MKGTWWVAGIWRARPGCSTLSLRMCSPATSSTQTTAGLQPHICESMGASGRTDVAEAIHRGMGLAFSGGRSTRVDCKKCMLQQPVRLVGNPQPLMLLKSDNGCPATMGCVWCPWELPCSYTAVRKRDMVCKMRSVISSQASSQNVVTNATLRARV